MSFGGSRRKTAIVSDLPACEGCAEGNKESRRDLTE